MEILKIVEAMQSYSEDVLAYKLDGGFANAVTEAVSLLIGQGEQIADLQNELRDERWIPVTERLPGFEIERVLVMIKGRCILGYPKMDTDRYVNQMWVRYGDNVTHWMPLPEPPKEVQ